MRILIISDPITPPSYAPRVMSFFRYLQEAGHDVVLESGEIVSASIWGKITHSVDRAFGHRLYKQYTQGQFDIILCSTYYYFPLWTAQYLSKKWHIPYVVDLRDIVEQWGTSSYFVSRLPNLFGIEKYLAKIYEKYNIRFRNRVIDGAKAVITVSPWHQQHLQSLTKTPVHLVYNGYNETEVRFSKQPTKAFSIAYIGRFIDLQLRQPQLLFDAVSKMELKDLSLDFYAEPEKEQEVRELAAQYGVQQYIQWHPYISREQLQSVLAQSSILLALGCPQKDGQHGILGTKVFEAIGVEKPLLLVPSDEDSLAQLIRETGIGCAARDKEEVKVFLRTKYTEWKQNGYTRMTIENMQNFSRRLEAEQMEKILCR